MPSSDAVTLIVSTGIGVSVIAGIVSGVCYILVHGLARKRNHKFPHRRWYCAICGEYLRSIEGVLEGDKVVTCSRCRGRVCKTRCSTRSAARTTKPEEWICHTCVEQPQSWIGGIISTIRLNYNRSESGIPSATTTMTTEQRIDEIDVDLEAVQKSEKDQVRDFIERLVSTMLDGTIDDASVTKLYNDNKHYDALFTRYHQDLCNSLTDLGSALHISIASKWTC